MKVPPATRPREVIVLAVRWYPRYGLSYRDVEELLAERGIAVDQVTLYRVGVHWSLGDAGAALHVGRGLHPGQFPRFPTLERRGRLHNDLARAWWQGANPSRLGSVDRVRGIEGESGESVIAMRHGPDDKLGRLRSICSRMVVGWGHR